MIDASTKRWAMRIGTVGATFALALAGMGLRPAAADQTTYDISTLAGKVASVNGTAGLQIRMSGLIEQDVSNDPATIMANDTSDVVSASSVPATPIGSDVTMNGDTGAAPQNETTVAVDPNNANRVVGAANDYVPITWQNASGVQGDGYSGTYFSINGGKTFCCTSTDSSHLGTLIPGVDHLAGGQYDGGGDPALAFDSRGNVYYSGLGFDRNAPPNTIAVNKGTFGTNGALSWSQPTFINATTAPSTFNDKEWIAADSHVSSPFRDRVYVSSTRFIFNPSKGTYVQSPISFAYSADGGKSFSSPQLISGNVLYGQGSRPVVGPDGTVYVFWDGSTRLAQYNSIYMVKSTDGGVNWSKPTAVSQLADISRPANTAFRVNSFPAAAVAPNGDLIVTWASELANTATSYSSSAFGYGPQFHAVAAYSKSTDGGTTWTTPSFDFATTNRTASGYPFTPTPKGTTYNAPAARPADTFFPAVAVSPSGTVYFSAYSADRITPRLIQTTGGIVDAGNATLDYMVTNVGTGETHAVNSVPINTRFGFGGRFIGDYTDISVGSDGVFHATWTDTRNVQSLTWFFGTNLNLGPRHQQDVFTAAGSF